MSTQTEAAHTIEAVIRCQQQFWQALQSKDAALLSQLLAESFVCRSPGAAEQLRGAFIATLVAMPVEVLRVGAEQIAVDHFESTAVLTGIQLAELRFPTGETAIERLALTNVFRMHAGHWEMVLARPVPVV